jgi:hypothetical protein
VQLTWISHAGPLGLQRVIVPAGKRVVSDCYLAHKRDQLPLHRTACHGACAAEKAVRCRLKSEQLHRKEDSGTACPASDALARICLTRLQMTNAAAHNADDGPATRPTHATFEPAWQIA